MMRSSVVLPHPKAPTREELSFVNLDGDVVQALNPLRPREVFDGHFHAVQFGSVTLRVMNKLYLDYVLFRGCCQ
jgi:hypothetical protein